MLLALVWIVGLLYFPLPHLAVEDAHGQLVWQPFLGLERRFSLRYRHSVQKTFAGKILCGENGDLVLVATVRIFRGGFAFCCGEGQLLTKKGSFI